MNKAYTSTGVRSVPIPLSDIARLFAIDELDEVIHLFVFDAFCGHLVLFSYTFNSQFTFRTSPSSLHTKYH